jgi:hypothetical protein
MKASDDLTQDGERVMTGQNLAWYKTQAEQLAAKIFDALKDLGDLLIRAGKDLDHDEYEDLENYLLTIWNRADLRAAKAVAKGELHPDLFPAGGKNSKVLTLSDIDQRALLDNDKKFEVYGNDGHLRVKSWRQMSPDERDRLLGPKGSRLYGPDEQRRPGVGKRTTRVVLYQKANYRDDRLTLNSGTHRGEIMIDALASTMPTAEFEELVAALIKQVPSDAATT